MRAWSPLGGSESGGSNDWVVAPKLSANGHAMLANDPHVTLSNPAAWHTLQLDAGAELRAEGVSLPGIPGIFLGHNDYGAWGETWRRWRRPGKGRRGGDQPSNHQRTISSSTASNGSARTRSSPPCVLATTQRPDSRR